MTGRQTGLNDTSPDTERVHVELFRQAGETRRLQLCLALSDEVLDLAWRALHGVHPNAKKTS